MFEDRQYQLDAVDFVMQDQGRPILCSPTGSGKSFICAMVAQRTLEQGGTFGILTPREEILYQMRDTMMEVCGMKKVGVLKAGENWNRSAPVQVISWPTLLSRTAKSEAWFPSVDTLAIDEAHLALSPKMAERVLPYYRERSKIFGVTATPARKSGKGLGTFFTHIKHVTTVRQLIKDEKLAPLEYWGGSLADISKVRTTAGDYNSKDLSDASQPLVGDVIDNWLRLASDRHTLVFAVDVAHCEALTERFQQAGIKAEALHVHMTPDQRHRVVTAFRSKRIQVLVNVTIASYGFDVPAIDCIVAARPTKSIVLHLQMLGRGMRIHDNKEACMVLDHADNVRRLGQADDLFRWRLDQGKQASENWTRNAKSEDAKKGEDKTYHCDNCRHIFSRTRVCPKCGTEIPMPKRDIETVDADLVRTSKQQEAERLKGWPSDRDFFLMLRHYQREKGYSFGWCLHKYKEKLKTEELPNKGWNSLQVIPPNERVYSWIRSQQIKWARSRKRSEGSEARA